MRSARRRSVSESFLLDLLATQLSTLRGGGPVEVVDVGGGTGGLARRLADQGHRLTVVDPSPDALASLARRTAEAGLGDRIVGVQGDAGDLASVLGPAVADVVVCHRTLEFVDDRLGALRAIRTVLRRDGALSLLVAQRPAAVVGYALSGHVGQARKAVDDTSRFDYDEVVALLDRAGFEPVASHGIGAVADHVPESMVEADPVMFDELLRLEGDVAQRPAFRAMAPVVHLFARPA